jgi:hypothetical protein
MFGFPFALFIQVAAAFVASVLFVIVFPAFLANVQALDIFTETDIFKMSVNNIYAQRP